MNSARTSSYATQLLLAIASIVELTAKIEFIRWIVLTTLQVFLLGLSMVTLASRKGSDRVQPRSPSEEVAPVARIEHIEPVEQIQNEVVE